MSSGAASKGLLTLAVVLTLTAGGVAAAQTAVAPETCARTDFEAVVDDAGEALRQLTQKNSPAFQAKLRALKDKRGWSHDQFVVEGVRFVRDDKITGFEAQSTTLLARINGAADQAGGTAAAVDCAQLAALKADMAALVAIQVEKWTYMFGNIDAELEK